MTKITVKLRTITPLFLGGAEPGTCELRPSSIKGMLRFWYRFIEGARCQGDWRKVRENEAKLFGSSDDGVGAFQIKLLNPLRGTPKPAQWDPGVKYLGYGPVDYKGPARPFIDAGVQFSFELLFARLADATAAVRIYEALWLWTHLGGFGSRARRGWGSLQLVEPKDDFTPRPIEQSNPDNHAAAIRDGIRQLVNSADLPGAAGYSHLLKGTQVICPYRAKTWEDCMRWIGDKLSNHRSFWKAKKFPTDHNKVNNYLSGDHNAFVDPDGVARAPVRATFGLPHNYFFSSRNKNDLTPEKAEIAPMEGEGRRGSPLFFRIHRFTNGQHAAVMTFVPSTFLPQDAKLRVRAGTQRKIPPSGWTTQPPPSELDVDAPGNYSAVLTFLSQFTNDAVTL